MTQKKDKLSQIPPELYERMKAHLYSKSPILGEESPVTSVAINR